MCLFEVANLGNYWFELKKYIKTNIKNNIKTNDKHGKYPVLSSNENIFVLDSQFVEEGYGLYNITPQPIGAVCYWLETATFNNC